MKLTFCYMANANMNSVRLTFKRHAIVLYELLFFVVVVIGRKFKKILWRMIFMIYINNSPLSLQENFVTFCHFVDWKYLILQNIKLTTIYISLKYILHFTFFPGKAEKTQKYFLNSEIIFIK